MEPPIIGRGARYQRGGIRILLQRIRHASLLFAQRAELKGYGGHAAMMRGEQPLQRRRRRIGFAQCLADLCQRLLVVEIGWVTAQRLLEGGACGSPVAGPPLEMADQPEEIGIVTALPDGPFEERN